MTKSMFDAPRGTHFHFYPEDLHIIRDPEHPLYDPREKEALDPLLVDNIQEAGVLEPVLVVRHEDLPDEMHISGVDLKSPIVIDGIQRVQHALEASKRIVKAGGAKMKVRALPQGWRDVKDLWAVKVTANFRRDETMLQRGRKALILQNSFGYSLDDIALHFVKNKITVQMWMDLAKNGSKELIAAVENGRIAATAAAKLCELPKKDQVVELDRLLSSGEKPTVKAAGKAVRDKKQGKDVVSKEPSKRLLRKIHETFSTGDENVTPLPVAYGFLKGIAFVLGEEDHKNLDDMKVVTIIDELMKGKEAPKKVEKKIGKKKSDMAETQTEA